MEMVMPQSEEQDPGSSSGGHANQALLVAHRAVLLRLDKAVHPVSWDAKPRGLSPGRTQGRNVLKSVGGRWYFASGRSGGAKSVGRSVKMGQLSPKHLAGLDVRLSLWS
jgi:hypothetical protein